VAGGAWQVPPTITVANSEPSSVASAPIATTRLSLSTTPSDMMMVPNAGGPFVPGPGRISITAQ